MEAGPEWAQNKRVVDLKKGIRNSVSLVIDQYFSKCYIKCNFKFTYQVPRGFPYFAVDFGVSNGYAHVVEDLSLFPSYFGREIIAGMMDLEPRFWRKPKPESTAELEEKVKKFSDMYEEFDTTKIENS